MEDYVRRLQEAVANSQKATIPLGRLRVLCPLPPELREETSLREVLKARSGLFEVLNEGKVGHEAVRLLGRWCARDDVVEPEVGTESEEHAGNESNWEHWSNEQDSQDRDPQEAYARKLYDAIKAFGEPMLLSKLGHHCPLPQQLRSSKQSLMSVLRANPDSFEVLNEGQNGHETVRALAALGSAEQGGAWAAGSGGWRWEESGSWNDRQWDDQQWEEAPWKESHWEDHDEQEWGEDTWQPADDELESYPPIQKFARNWRMPLEAVVEVLLPLRHEQRLMIMSKFDYNPSKAIGTAPPPQAVLRNFVASCERNGWRKSKKR